MTKDPFSLGIIGLMGIVPAMGIALFDGYFVDQSEKRGLLAKCIPGVSIVGLFLVTLPPEEGSCPPKAVLCTIYGLVLPPCS